MSFKNFTAFILFGLYSVPAFSQKIPEEIVGEWVVTDRIIRDRPIDPSKAPEVIGSTYKFTTSGQYWLNGKKYCEQADVHKTEEFERIFTPDFRPGSLSHPSFMIEALTCTNRKGEPLPTDDSYWHQIDEWTIICEKVPDYDLGDHPLDLMVVDENTVVGAVDGRGELYFFCLKRKGTEGGQNEAPLASAGEDQKVSMWHKVTLDGRGSIDPDGDNLTYQWEQIAGKKVKLSDPSSPSPTFKPPFTIFPKHLKFRLTVSDGKLESTDEVTVTVRLWN